MRSPLTICFALFCLTMTARAQRVGSSPEYIKQLTPLWKGERSADGRPKVSDNMLKRLKDISLEDVWNVLRNHGYQNQFEGEWHVIHPDSSA
ncbi:MAG TPA: hypothetical protein VK518_16890, partial [Puia sp.]|nr:hypothetical protein [Puia sp.]